MEAPTLERKDLYDTIDVKEFAKLARISVRRAQQLAATMRHYTPNPGSKRPRRYVFRRDVEELIRARIQEPPDQESE